jgi:hypothetical protein
MGVKQIPAHVELLDMDVALIVTQHITKNILVVRIIKVS